MLEASDSGRGLKYCTVPVSVVNVTPVLCRAVQGRLLQLRCCTYSAPEDLTKELKVICTIR